MKLLIVDKNSRKIKVETAVCSKQTSVGMTAATRKNNRAKAGSIGVFVVAIFVSAILLLPEQFKSEDLNQAVNEMKGYFHPESISSNKKSLKLVMYRASSYLKENTSNRLVQKKLKKERLLSKKLAAGGCSDTVAHELVKSFWGRKKYKKILKFQQNYTTACGAFNELRWAGFESAKSLGMNSLALKMISQLIKESPRDKDYWAWRGLLYQKLGMNQKAIIDYTEVIDLAPKVRSIPLNLVQSYRDSNQPCPATRVLRLYVRNYPALQTDPEVFKLYSQVQEACQTAGLAGS